MKTLWMAVTPDEYELPLMVADTARELGEKYGLSKRTIISAAGRDSGVKRVGRKFVRVKYED